MNNGFSSFKENYQDINQNEIKKALEIISDKQIVSNYIMASEDGKKDDWVETDREYSSFSPSLLDYIQNYVENNKDVIFK